MTGVTATPDAVPHPRRRRVLALAGAWAVPGSASLAATGQAPTGWLQPRLPAPPLRLTAGDGHDVSFAATLAGKVTAVQLMFTGCSASCPTQGAFFAALATRMHSAEAQLLSISIDALGDTPASMAAWQARFGVSRSWFTAVADAASVDRLAAFLKGVAGKAGTHTGQVFAFDREARLCYRTGDWPGIDELDALLGRVARLG